MIAFWYLICYLVLQLSSAGCISLQRQNETYGILGTCLAIVWLIQGVQGSCGPLCIAQLQATPLYVREGVVGAIFCLGKHPILLYSDVHGFALPTWGSSARLCNAACFRIVIPEARMTVVLSHTTEVLGSKAYCIEK